jgi:hypothetical protein
LWPLFVATPSRGCVEVRAICLHGAIAA